MKYLNLLVLSLAVGRLFCSLEKVLGGGEQVLCYLPSSLVRGGLILGRLGTSAVLQAMAEEEVMSKIAVKVTNKHKFIL